MLEIGSPDAAAAYLSICVIKSFATQPEVPIASQHDVLGYTDNIGPLRGRGELTASFILETRAIGHLGRHRSRWSLGNAWQNSL